MDENQRKIIDAVLALPQSFTMGDKQLNIYPATLGVALRASLIVEQLGINKTLLLTDRNTEAIRIAQTKPNEVLEMIAYYTLTGAEHQDSIAIKQRIEQLAEGLSIEDMATLLLVILEQDQTAELLKILQVEQDRAEQKRIYDTRDKKSGKVITFGGHSVFGQMLDRAAERYGWSKEYIVWGVDATSLRLMLEDAINSAYLSADEAKKARISTDGVRVNMDNRERAMQFIKSQKWH
jgi:hypothetical protein